MQVRLDERGVLLTLQGLEVLMALRRRLHIPFSRVRGVERGVAAEPTWRLLGTAVGRLRFGLFRTAQGEPVHRRPDKHIARSPLHWNEVSYQV